MNNTPLCVHENPRTRETVYLTAKKVAEIILKAVERAMPGITKGVEAAQRTSFRYEPL